VTVFSKRKSLLCGETFLSKFDRLYTVVKRCGGGRYLIESDGVILNRHISEIKRGQVKHPLDKTVYGRGFLGIGKYTYEENEHRADCWRAMFKRCYSGNRHYNSYSEIVVAEDWHNFQNFAEWYNNNYVVGYELDKDFKNVSPAKEYSPATCMFLPHEINKALSHKYTCLPAQEGVKYRARISIGGKAIELGRYTEWENAVYFQIQAKFSIIEQKLCLLYGKDFTLRYWNRDRLLRSYEESVNAIKDGL
jgi:hypothetical protein